ncbi:MAG: GAF domain-containing protein [Bryobacteraceae bacterium]|nr:GAF domain-containing protein [Bryobacteraceae bacterium]
MRAGERVVVRGTVAAGPIPVLDYAHLSIQDEAGHGLVLEASLDQLQNFRPGDVITAAGMAGHRAGLPVLKLEKIERKSTAAAPAPQPARIADLNSPRLLGRWVETEGEVQATGSNRGGETLRITSGGSEITVFYPFLAKRDAGFSGFRARDRVRVRGIASQYSPLPPYNRSYQLMIGSADWVTLLERRSWPPAWPGAVAISVVALVLLAWFIRERRLAKQPRRTRRLYRLGERMLACREPSETQKLLTESLPELLGVTSVRLYLYDSAASALRLLGDPAGVTIVPLSPPPAELRARTAALCFTNRTPIVIPDVRRNAGRNGAEALPRALLVVPMLVQREPLGVLELAHESKRRAFSEDEVAVVQHLANQIAIGMRLLEREALREQRGGSEQYQALRHVAGLAAREFERWMAGGELGTAQEPDGHEAPASRGAPPPEVFAAAARLSRLCASSTPSPAAVDFTALVQRQIEQRRPDWEKHGITLREHVTPEPLVVAGIGLAWLEEVLGSAFEALERALAAGGSNVLRLRVSRLAGSVMLEAAAEKVREAVLTDPPQGPGSAWVLPMNLAGGLVRSWGGELRWKPEPPAGPGFELELPLAPALAGMAALARPTQAPQRALTALLLDPEPDSRPSLLSVLGNAGHRCVAAAGAEQASQMLRNMSFDVVLCAQQTPRRSWEELFVLTRQKGIPFVLLTQESGRPESIRTAAGQDSPLFISASEEELLSLLVRIGAGNGPPDDGYNED